MNDPAFELQFNLPELRLDDDGNVVSQKKETQKTSSQMSPFSNNLSSGSRGSAAGLLVSQCPASVSFHHLEMPFGRDSLASQKPGEGGLNMAVGEEEPLIMDDDWGIHIDADGNIVQEEPELPALPNLHSDNAGPVLPQDEPGPVLEDEAEMIIDMGGDALPEAEAFPQPQRPQDQLAIEDSSSVTGVAPARNRKPKLIRPDRSTMLRRADQHALNNNYLARMDQARNKPRGPTAAQGRHNANQYLFGNGIFGVGVDNGITGPNHPLGQLFSGVTLQRNTFGFVIDGDDGQGEEEAQAHGQRRSSGQAFPEDAEAEEGRRVRPRLDDNQPGQAAQLSIQEDKGAFFEPEIEVGREPGSVLSNVSAPWNRPGSLPGSSAKGSVRATGAGPSRVSASPLHGRGANLPAIERFSDDLPFGSDGLLPHESSSVYGGPAGGEGATATSQMMQDALDGEGRNFLGFVEGVAATKGDDDGAQRRWLDFDDLFEPRDANKVVVTQAFCHILTLATRDMIKVRQEDSREVEFGTIRIGVKVAEAAAGVAEDDVAAGEVGRESEAEGFDDDAMVA